MRIGNKKTSKSFGAVSRSTIRTKEVKSGSSKRNRFRYTAATELQNVWFGDRATYLHLVFLF